MEEPSVDLAHSIVIDAEDIRSRQRVALHPGVEYTLLWRKERDVAGMMWLTGGSEVPEHTHRHSEHHVWVITGRARVGDAELGPGGYWHVPPGVPHTIAGVAPTGCMFAYLFVNRPAD